VIPFCEGFKPQPGQINRETVEIGNKLCLCIGEFVVEDCSNYTINVWLKDDILDIDERKVSDDSELKESVDEPLGDLTAADLK